MTGDRIIAIDIGGTQLRLALFQNNAILARDALPTDVAGGPSGVMSQIDRLIDRLCPAAARADLRGIGLSLAGPIDTETGFVTKIPTLPGWDGFPVRRALFERTGVPVHVENDAIAATLGEWRHGAGQGMRNIVYLTVSTGIGGGAVVDGNLLRGRKGIAGHLGHMRMAQDGPVCCCGTTGCFEAFASGSALRDRAVDAAAASGFLSNIPDIEARHVFEGARAVDSVCVDLLAGEAMYLGQGITSVIHMFSPDRVIMGGGLSNGFDLLDKGMHDIIRRDAMPPFKDVPVVKAGLGGDSGLFGAASLVADAARG